MNKPPSIRYDGDELIISTWHPAPLWHHGEAAQALCIARHGQIAMQALDDAIAKGAWMRGVQQLNVLYNDATTAVINTIVLCSVFLMGNVAEAQV